MRRSLAIVLAIVFSILLILPAFAGRSTSGLPACCSKTGKHHCGMGSAVPFDGTTSVSSIHEKCPYLSAASVAPQVESWTQPIHRTVFAGLVPKPDARYEAQADRRSSSHRSEQKRGPPSIVLS